MLRLVEVSIIVPVYNVEKYLGECLDSLCNQTFKDLEIVCINDGSSDGSLEILEDYAEKDKRISIYSQENKGLSATRNAGMKKITGRYVYFMDSDDILEIDAIEKLHNLCEEKSLDLVLFKLINFYDGTDEKFESAYYNMEFLKNNVGDNVFSYEDIKEDIVKIAVNAQSKFFKRDLIEDMEFNEGLIFEDNPFTIEAIFKSQRTYFLDEFIYLKRERKGSITTSHDKSFVDVIAIANKIIDLTKQYGKYDELKHAVINKKFRRILKRYDEIDSEFKQYFFEKIKEDFISREDEYRDVLSEESSQRILFEKSLDLSTCKEFDMTREIISLNNENRQINLRYNKVKKYNSARIQFKNVGQSTNKMEILKTSDDDLRVDITERSQDNKGQVMFVQSDANSLDLKLKAVGDGLLTVKFRSFNMKMDNDERFHVYLDYTRIMIDNRDYITQNKMVSYHEPFKIEKRVKDSQVIDVHVEWRTLSSDSEYVNKYDALKKEHNALEKDYNHIKRVNKMLYKDLGIMRSSTSWKVTKPIRVVGDFTKGKKK